MVAINDDVQFSADVSALFIARSASCADATTNFEYCGMPGWGNLRGRAKCNFILQLTQDVLRQHIFELDRWIDGDVKASGMATRPKGMGFMLRTCLI
eukprot:scaffold608653_cov48-Prasinocladus_malaysianus.AAC.1